MKRLEALLNQGYLGLPVVRSENVLQGIKINLGVELGIDHIHPFFDGSFNGGT